uniref:TECR-like N-terminal domain-containing protein n=1 Tax=Anser cygnoides TaxID=8845 RepID=A0A8B9DQR5_ANSCY
MKHLGTFLLGNNNYNFVSYQVEILDWKTKEQLCFLDKVKQKSVQNARQSIKLDPTLEKKEAMKTSVGGPCSPSLLQLPCVW